MTVEAALALVARACGGGGQRGARDIGWWRSAGSPATCPGSTPGQRSRPPGRSAARSGGGTPFIYSDGDVLALIEQAEAVIPQPLRAATYADADRAARRDRPAGRGGAPP